ncbi:hypothetical protein JXO52_10715 [bacterium]|nr:hypothetical protein [bacterium]
MSCPEFEKSGLLFISGELEKEEAKAYRMHLRECDTCLALVREYRELFAKTEGLAELSPGPEIRERVLAAGSRAAVKSAAGKDTVFSRLSRALFPAPWMWGIPAAAIVVLMLLLNPFARNSAELDDVLAWNDDFLLESAMIEADIENVKTLTATPYLEEDVYSPVPNVSTLNDEFISIRNGIEDLLQEITGF